jgi:ABC-type antimicrobial peptide transport system permease subunit
LLYADEYYASTFNIPMAAGDFYGAPGTITDSSKIVINEAGSKALGWANPNEAIGKQLNFPGTPGLFTIAGVTKDFHFGSMQKAIQPVTFLQVSLSTTFRFFSFKLKPGTIDQSIKQLQKKWAVLMPGAPFEYKFMDDSLKKLYKTEIQLKQAAYTAASLSLIIVLLGVLGLISLSVQKRTKEIGIRKVLGSSVKGIIALFLKEFLGIALVAGVLACPVAWLLMKKWLSDYVYRIDMTAMPFVTAIVLLGFITASLIIIQTIKTALANPVKSLRTE